MNHYRAAQREIDKRWDYVTGNRRSGTYPIGYCAGWREIEDYGPSNVPGLSGGLARDIEALRPHQDKFHHDGHATEEEACECYRRYLLDVRLRLYDPATLTKPPETLHKCQAPECTQYTAGFAEVDTFSRWHLCDSHRSRDIIDTLLPKVGQAWSSY